MEKAGKRTPRIRAPAPWKEIRLSNPDRTGRNLTDSKPGSTRERKAINGQYLPARDDPVPIQSRGIQRSPSLPFLAKVAGGGLPLAREEKPKLLWGTAVMARRGEEWRQEGDGARRTRSLPAVVSPELVLFLGHHVLHRPVRYPKCLTDKWASSCFGAACHV